MDSLARDCNQALQYCNGPALAATISPIAPPRFLNRLESIYHSSNSSTIQQDIGRALVKNAHRSLSQDDSQALEVCAEIYVAYWHAIGALIAAEDGGDWSRVYDAWKGVVNAVIRGYSSSFENWTLPLLYTAGKHLRQFAMKADETKKGAEGSTAIDMGGIQDDIAGDYGKNIKLEDAARVLNRMFTLCISDRYVDFNSISKPFLTVVELRWKSRGNGASTTSPVSCSKRTSNSIRSACLRTSCVLYRRRVRICRM